MPDKEYAEERDQLSRLGVPDHVIEHALSHKPTKASYLSLLWGGLTLMIFCIFGSIVFIGSVGNAAVDSNALFRAQSEAALFYQYNFGLSPLFSIFAAIFISGTVMIGLAGLTQRIRASQFVYGLMNKKTQKHLPKKEKMAALSSIGDPEVYMDKLMPNPVGAFTWAGVALAAMTVASFERDIDTYEIMTPTQYIATPWFPWEGEVSLYWRDATHVELGCGRFSSGRGGTRYEIVYQVHFSSGRSVSLDEARPVEGNWLDAIEILDDILETEGATFERWRGDLALHAKCLAKLARRYKGKDLNRIHDLLRLREL